MTTRTFLGLGLCAALVVPAACTRTSGEGTTAVPPPGSPTTPGEEGEDAPITLPTDPTVDHTLTMATDDDTVTAWTEDAQGQTSAGTIVRLEVAPPVDGVVAKLSAEAGELASSTVLIEQGVGQAVWFAPKESELQAQTSLDVVLSADLALNTAQALTASASVTVEAAAEGAPALSLEVVDLPENLVADGSSAVVIRVRGLRLEAGSLVTLTSGPASVGVFGSGSGEQELTLDDDLVAEANFVVSTTPGEATITARWTDPDDASRTATADVQLTTRAEDAPEFDLTGTWAQLVFGRVRLESAGLDPNPQCIMSPTLMIWEMEHEGLEVTIKNRTCRVAMPAVNSTAGLTQTTPGPNFYQAIGEVESRMTLPGKELGISFESEEGVTVLGANVVDPEGVLPTSSSEPSVVDADGDGQPGVTVNIVGTPLAIGDGDKNIVSRTRSQLRGTIESSSLIQGDELGSVDTLTETVVLDDWLANTFAPAIVGLPSSHRVVRVDGLYGSLDVSGRDGDPTSITCDDVLSAESEIFADMVVPDTPADCAGL